jgi:hypothetical protein
LITGIWIQIHGIVAVLVKENGNTKTMKKIYFIITCMIVVMLSACSKDESESQSKKGSTTVSINAKLPNSRVTENDNSTYGLKTTWNSDDKLSVLYEESGTSSFAKATFVNNTTDGGNSFVCDNLTDNQYKGFHDNSLCAVNDNESDNITASIDETNPAKASVTVDLTGQDGTYTNVAKYDLLEAIGSGGGDNMVGNERTLEFKHQMCVLRFAIPTSSLPTSVSSMTFTYAPSSSNASKLLASQDVFTFVYGGGRSSEANYVDKYTLSNPSLTDTNGTTYVYLIVPPTSTTLNGSLIVDVGGGDSYNYRGVVDINGKQFVNQNVEATALNMVKIEIGDFIKTDGGIVKHDSGGAPKNISTTDEADIVGLITSASPTTSVTDYDAAAGYTHGYAMALTDSRYNGSADFKWYDVDPTINATITSEDFQSALKDNYGYKWTKECEAAGYSTTVYPAAYGAVNFNGLTSPAASSGWFLPSAGQLYQVWVDFCNVTNGIDDSNYWHINTNTFSAYTSLNSALNGANSNWSLPKVADAALFTPQYWTSSMNSDINAFSICIYNNTFDQGAFDLYYNAKNIGNRVRSFVAF